MIEVAAAEKWMTSWDAQQEVYAHRREERFTIVSGLVSAAVADREHPVVVDIGAGPGSLAVRIARELPHARVLAVEADPFLVELGRAWCGGRVEFVDTLVGGPGWLDRLGVDRIDAAASSTALHYPSEELLAAIYRDVHSVMAPGGVLVNADHFPLDPSAHDLPPTSGDGGTAWKQWWATAESAEELAAAMRLRAKVTLPAGGDNGLSTKTHLRLLAAAGFRTEGVVWRDGVSAVIVARAPTRQSSVRVAE